MCFRKNGYELIDNVLTTQTLSVLSNSFDMFNDLRVLNDPKGHFGDTQVYKSLSHYSFLPFESLLLELQSNIENVVEKELFPCFSYGRTYLNGAEMLPHLDREYCEYSASITLQAEDPVWEIYMTNLNGVKLPIKIPVGSMLVFKGNVLEHWRTPYKGKKQTQVFLHYVDKNGIYSDFKFDKRPLLGQ